MISGQAQKNNNDQNNNDLKNDRQHNDRQKNNRQRGSALVYILIAIALLAALTVSFMEPSSQQTQSQNTFKAVSDLQSQIDFIRTTVQECVLKHPTGDGTIDNSGSGTDPGANVRYPLMPNSTHLPVALRAANEEVSNLRCPGNPGGDPNHVRIFGGSSGKFLPPAPSLFTEWEWYNGTDGTFYWTETDKSDAYLQTALQKLDDNMSECEADIIDATAAQVELTSTAGASDPKCPAGSTCFRVWMMLKPSASGPHQDAGC